MLKNQTKALLKSNKHTYKISKKSRNVYVAQKANINRAKDKIQGKYANNKYDALIKEGLINVSRRPNTKIAVIIHLFYFESWPTFQAKLQNLEGNKFDLFVSMPKNNAKFIQDIRKSYPNANVFLVPNRGRDVLPFIKTIPIIQKQGYEYLLKMHSKKSNHRTDGNEWLSDMIDKLLPENRTTMKEILKRLNEKNTGIVGPSGHYISLSVNFRQNWHHAGNIISRIYTKKLSNNIKRNYKKYGFFAGTMFWSRVDALEPILSQNFRANNFEKEKGQIDTTFAHALERVFCIIQAIEKRQMYEAGKNSINPIKYKTKNIPNWSKIYKGPMP